MLLSTKTKRTFAVATAVSMIGAVAWAQNLEVKGNAWFATGGSGSAGIGTNAPLGKLHVVAPGGFGAENADGTATVGNVPIVAQSNGTALGVLNAYGRPVFAVDVSGVGTTSGSRGYVTLSEKSTGTWFPSLTFSSGRVGVGRMPASYRMEVGGDVYVAGGWLRTAGTTGWYSESYGGGWFMQDTSWIRTYGSKSVWAGGGVVGSDGGFTAGFGGTAPPAGGAVINGSVGIGKAAPAFKLDVNGAIAAGNSDVYLTNTAHNHSGIGNTPGYAAIENAADYGTLMILGRAGTSVGRRVDVWDYLNVNGRLRSTTGTVVYVTNGSCNTPPGGTLSTVSTCQYIDTYWGYYYTYSNAVAGRLVDY